MENLIITSRAGVQFIAPAKILYLHAKGSYCIIKTIDGKETIVAKNLNYLHNLLTPNSAFLRVHRSWVINKNHIVGFIKLEESRCRHCVKLKGGETIRLPAGTAISVINELKSSICQDTLQQAINHLLSFSPSERLYIIEQALYPSPGDAETKTLRPFKMQALALKTSCLTEKNHPKLIQRNSDNNSIAM